MAPGAQKIIDRWDCTILKSFCTANVTITNILGHKGNANQNDIEILSYPSQNDYHQNNKKQ
jgi:hypothetical protein